MSFADYPAGNTTFSGTSSCGLPPPATGATRCYLYDYQLLGLSAEYSTKVGALPLTVWGDYIQNRDPGDRNEGYGLGFKLGKASDPRSWELGLLYADVEADAQWGGFVDSDFAGGTTQSRGFQVKGGWAPVKNVLVNLAWFDNDRYYDTAGELDYQRMQLDVSFKF